MAKFDLPVPSGEITFDYFYHKCYIYNYGFREFPFPLPEKERLELVLNKKLDYLKLTKIEDYTIQDIFERFVVNSIYMDITLNELDAKNTFFETLNLLDLVFKKQDLLSEENIIILRTCLCNYYLFLSSNLDTRFTFTDEEKTKLFKIGVKYIKSSFNIGTDYRKLLGSTNDFFMSDFLKTNKEFIFEDENIYIDFLNTMRTFSEFLINNECYYYGMGYLENKTENFKIILNLDFINNPKFYIDELLIEDYILKEDYAGILNLLYTNNNLHFLHNCIFLKSYLIRVLEEEQDKDKLQTIFNNYPFLNIFKDELL